MLRMLIGAVAGALIAVLVIGYVTGPPDLPGRDWVKRFWSKPSVQKTQEGTSNIWTAKPRIVNGEVEITAWGGASTEESKNQSHAVALALRTARHLAYEQLAEFLRGARTNGQSEYQADVLQTAALTTKTAAVIKGARIVKEEVKTLPDGSVRAVVTLRHPLPKKVGT